MFDSLGWSYEYEPVDLAGYIPDFVLLGNASQRPIAVECKPFVAVDTSVVAHCNRIARSGWIGPALVLGAVQFTKWEDGAIGIGRAFDDGRSTWVDCYLGRFRPSDTTEAADPLAWQWWPRLDLRATLGSKQNLRLHAEDYLAARLKWAEAGNATQWNPPTTPEVK